MTSDIWSSVKACAGFAAALALWLLATPAAAADPIFPMGSHLGLVPPAGMVASDSFAGFADPNKNAAILLTTLPAAAYPQIERTLDSENFKKQGINIEKREQIKLKDGKGVLLTGRQVVDKARYRKWLLLAAAGDLTALITVQVPEQDNVYSDVVVRAALATLSVRATVPENEQLGLLPFTVGDLAGFHVDGVMPGRALLLSDAADQISHEQGKPAPKSGLVAHLLVAAVPGGPAEPDQRENFARLAFNEISGIKDVHITIFEPLRIGGQPGYQTVAEAKDTRTGTDVMAVQWLRFGTGGFLQMVGIARADSWTSALSRLRAIRDSIEPK